MAVTSDELILVKPLPLVVLRYTLYPLTLEVLAFQFSVTVCGAVEAAVKFTPVLFAPLIVTFVLTGVNAKPELVGVTV